MRKKKTKTQKQKPSPDSLIEFDKKGHIELSEKELGKVTGGTVVEKVGPDSPRS